MSRRARVESLGGSLSVSFLDVLSNGLGASILLMVLITAIPPQRAAAPVPNGQFIRASWTVTGDPGALLAVTITPPNALPFHVDLQMLEGGSVEFDCRWPGVTAAGKMSIYGFTLAGTDAALRTPYDTTTPPDRTYVLWVQEPVQGSWTLSITYFNRDDSLRDPGRGIQIAKTLETLDKQEADTEPTPIGFGDVVKMNTLIGAYNADDAEDTRLPCQ